MWRYLYIGFNKKLWFSLCLPCLQRHLRMSSCCGCTTRITPLVCSLTNFLHYVLCFDVVSVIWIGCCNASGLNVHNFKCTRICAITSETLSFYKCSEAFKDCNARWLLNNAYTTLSSAAKFKHCSIGSSSK